MLAHRHDRLLDEVLRKARLLVYRLVHQASMITSWIRLASRAVMQAEATDAVIMRVERARGVFAQHGAECVDQRLPEVGPVAARPGCHHDIHANRSGHGWRYLVLYPAVQLLSPFPAHVGSRHPGRELRGDRGGLLTGRSHRQRRLPMDLAAENGGDSFRSKPPGERER